MTLALTPRDPRIHVFSVSDGALKLTHQTYLSRLSEEVSATSLETAVGDAEVFAVEDVAPMGLRAYLAQAHDIPDPVLAADAARLDALSGDVVVLAPRAVEGLQTLTPRPELTHIGSYAPAEADDSPRSLPRASKSPHLETPGSAVGNPMTKRRIVWIVLGAVVAATLLLMLW